MLINLLLLLLLLLPTHGGRSATVRDGRSR
jgi:hypothetical protein